MESVNIRITKNFAAKACDTVRPILAQLPILVTAQMAYWTRFDKFEADIMTTLEKLNDLVDESDPDVDVPNIVHAFQTAERIRADYPDLDWFHLTGLIHDLGKVR